MRNYQNKVKIQNKAGKEIETHIGTDNKVWFVRCGCTGNTKEKATQMYYNHKKQVVYCPHCHKEITPTKTLKEYEQEEQEKEAQKPLQLIKSAYDWETGLTYYKLNKKIDKEDWNKVKQYFHYFTEEDEFYTDMTGARGWLTRNPEQVEEILGITNTIQQQEKEQETRQQQEKTKLHQKQELQDHIHTMFKYAEPCTPTSLTTLEEKAEHIIDDPYYEWDIYGGGRKWIITQTHIYQITNNGFDGADWSMNNIETGGAGAIGIVISRIPENEQILLKYKELGEYN